MESGSSSRRSWADQVAEEELVAGLHSSGLNPDAAPFHGGSGPSGLNPDAAPLLRLPRGLVGTVRGALVIHGLGSI